MVSPFEVRTCPEKAVYGVGHARIWNSAGLSVVGNHLEVAACIQMPSPSSPPPLWSPGAILNSPQHWRTRLAPEQ